MVQHLAENAAAFLKGIDLIGETFRVGGIVSEVGLRQGRDRLFQFRIAGIVGDDDFEQRVIHLLAVDAGEERAYPVHAPVGGYAKGEERFRRFHPSRS